MSPEASESKHFLSLPLSEPKSVILRNRIDFQEAADSLLPEWCSQTHANSNTTNKNPLPSNKIALLSLLLWCLPPCHPAGEDPNVWQFSTVRERQGGSPRTTRKAWSHPLPCPTRRARCADGQAAWCTSLHCSGQHTEGLWAITDP